MVSPSGEFHGANAKTVLHTGNLPPSVLSPGGRQAPEGSHGISRSAGKARMIRWGTTPAPAGRPRPPASTQTPWRPRRWGAATSHSRLSPTIHALSLIHISEPTRLLSISYAV